MRRARSLVSVRSASSVAVGASGEPAASNDKDYARSFPTKLGRAVAAGLADKVERLARKSPTSVSQADEHGVTPLMLAAQINRADLIKSLLLHDASINARDAAGASALHHACRAGHTEAAVALVAAGADAGAADEARSTPLHAAAASGAAACVVAVLEARPNVDAADEDACTPLHLAADAAAVDSVQALVQAGADANAVDAQRRSVLMYACVRGSHDVIALLLRSGADVRHIDADGRSAVEHAELSKHSDLIDMLQQVIVKHSSDVSLVPDTPHASASTATLTSVSMSPTSLGSESMVSLAPAAVPPGVDAAAYHAGRAAVEAERSARIQHLEEKVRKQFKYVNAAKKAVDKSKGKVKDLLQTVEQQQARIKALDEKLAQQEKSLVKQAAEKQSLSAALAAAQAAPVPAAGAAAGDSVPAAIEADNVGAKLDVQRHNSLAMVLAAQRDAGEAQRAQQEAGARADAAEQDLRRLQSRVAETSALLEAESAQRARVERSLQSVQAELRGAKQAMTASEQTLAQRDAQIRRLDAELSDAASLTDKLKTQLQHTEDALRASQEDSKAASARSSALYTQSLAWQEEREELQAQVRQLQVRLQTLSSGPVALASESDNVVRLHAQLRESTNAVEEERASRQADRRFVTDALIMIVRSLSAAANVDAAPAADVEALVAEAQRLSRLIQARQDQRAAQSSDESAAALILLSEEKHRLQEMLAAARDQLAASAAATDTRAVLRTPRGRHVIATASSASASIGDEAAPTRTPRTPRTPHASPGTAGWRGPQAERRAVHRLLLALQQDVASIWSGDAVTSHDMLQEVSQDESELDASARILVDLVRDVWHQVLQLVASVEARYQAAKNSAAEVSHRLDLTLERCQTLQRQCTQLQSELSHEGSADARAKSQQDLVREQASHAATVQQFEQTIDQLSKQFDQARTRDRHMLRQLRAQVHRNDKKAVAARRQAKRCQTALSDLGNALIAAVAVPDARDLPVQVHRAIRVIDDTLRSMQHSRSIRSLGPGEGSLHRTTASSALSPVTSSRANVARGAAALSGYQSLAKPADLPVPRAAAPAAAASSSTASWAGADAAAAPPLARADGTTRLPVHQAEVDADRALLSELDLHIDSP